MLFDIFIIPHFYGVFGWLWHRYDIEYCLGYQNYTLMEIG